MGQGVHLPNFLANPECRVVALAEARPKLAQAVAARHGIARVYSSPRELAADPEVEAVAAITSETLHPQTVPELLGAGKHVYVEKPLATTVEGGRPLVDAATAAGVTLMVGYMKRYDSGIRRAKDLLDECMAAGDLGRITYARAHCFGGNWIASFKPPLLTSDEPAPQAPRTAPRWLPDDQRDAYFVFVNVYCHNINLLRWFLGGEPEVKYAHRRGAVTVATLDFDGVPAVLETGSLPARRWDESMTIFFERGWLEVMPAPPLHPEPARVSLYRATHGHEVIAPLGEWKWSFAAAAEHFVACVAAGTPPLTPAADALNDLEVCQDVFRRLVDSS